MPLNFFAPAGGLATDRPRLTQMRECAEMVAAFHKKGIAVIADVVMNHLGLPTSALFIDKAYYFRMNSEGGLTNWSGCGNDFRTESAMAERMLLEALEHWVRVYGVDGFRFDLAELLGVNFLKKVQERLRKINPKIILIAEPWSFRGHIAAGMKNTDYACWNDGFREFVPGYLRGRAGVETAKYFLKGSVGGVTARPVQTINYVESHDDHTWIDKITQNPDKNGYYPTLHDRRLTHLMAGLLTMSLGVPMWVAGGEAMRSKYGVGNTYLRGDLNAIDWAREREYPATVQYIRGLNLFRRGPNGKALRVRELPEGYLQFFEVPGTSALGALYNAEEKIKAKRLLYLLNPTHETVKMPLTGLKPKEWKQIADFERIDESGLAFGKFEWKEELLELPALSAGIFVEK